MATYDQIKESLNPVQPEAEEEKISALVGKIN